MNNKIFPNSFSDALSNFYRWFLFFLYFLIFGIFSLCLFSFNQIDTSLLFISSAPVTNYLGIYGSYLSSFLIYCFGSLSFIVPIFFLLAAIHQILKTYLDFIFLRFFLFVPGHLLVRSYRNHRFLIFSDQPHIKIGSGMVD